MLALKKYKEWSDKFEPTWHLYQRMTCNSIQKISTGAINYALTYMYPDDDPDYYLVGINSGGIVTGEKINQFVIQCKGFKNKNQKIKLNPKTRYFWIFASTTQLTPSAKKIAAVYPQIKFIYQPKNEDLIREVELHIIRSIGLMELDLEM